MRGSRWGRAAVAAALGLATLAPLVTGDGVPASAVLVDPTPVGAPAAPPATMRVLASMSLPQQVGQLLMLGVSSTSASRSEIALLRRYHVGSVVLLGNSTKSLTATAAITHTLHSARSAGAGLMVTVDQEGGTVQRLRGPGFGPMPTALAMGGWSAQRVRNAAARWGHQLRRAGIDVDLAPVLDVVPTSMSRTNLPIGSLGREFGHTPARVTRKGGAFASGLAHAGIGYALKHFPGLGRVRGNTDFTSGVTDNVTTRHDANLAPYARAIDAHAPAVLVSTATYRRIDKSHPAVFSHTVLTGMLRGDLGFDGVVLSDTLSGAQLAAWSPASRALQFVRAGGDIALVGSAADLPKMYGALLKNARQHAGFRALVRAAAQQVLTMKQRYRLLSANPG